MVPSRYRSRQAYVDVREKTHEQCASKCPFIYRKSCLHGSQQSEEAKRNERICETELVDQLEDREASVMISSTMMDSLSLLLACNYCICIHYSPKLVL
jgi:hypothetical protein